MAINSQAAAFLLEAARNGVSFERCLTLGRQHYLVGNKETSQLLKRYDRDPTQYPKVFEGDYLRRYADAFFELLGTRTLETLDISDFDGATWIHDLNLPPADETRNGRFDVVYDGGTLEHVFNFPQAIKTCMEMTRVGGHVIIHTPANNYMGHGFYQFSPELFFRVFSKRNGFEVTKILVCEGGPRSRVFEAMDPDLTKNRGEVVNCFQLMLFVVAKRLEAIVPFTTFPQQSDYEFHWDMAAKGAKIEVVNPRRSFELLLLQEFPRLARFLQAFKFSQLNRRMSLRNTLFRPLSHKR